MCSIMWRTQLSAAGNRDMGRLLTQTESLTCMHVWVETLSAATLKSSLLNRTVTQPHNGSSKKSKGVPLQKVRDVHRLVLQNLEAHPMFSAARDAVATGEALQFAELHVFHLFTLSAEITLSSGL
jgi:hypothetical protein